MLVLRRSVAFLLDVALLSCILLLLLIIVVFGGVHWDVFGDLCLWGAVLCYFGIWESLGGGQTPGKRRMRIRVCSTDGSGPSLYQAFGRVVILACAPFLVDVIKSALVSGHIIDLDREALIISMVSAFVLALLPASVFSSGGLAGIHDLAMGAKVVAVKAPMSVQDLAMKRYIGLTVFSAVLISLLVTLPERVIFSPMRKTAEAGGMELVNLMTQNSIDADSLWHSAENSGEFIEGPALSSIDAWDVKTRNGIRFSNSPLTLPPMLGQVMGQLKGCVTYEIGVTESGFLSGDFQRNFATHIVSTLPRPDLAYRFFFRLRRRVPFLGISFQRNLVAFLLPASEGGFYLFLAEPDGSFVAEVNLRDSMTGSDPEELSENRARGLLYSPAAREALAKLLGPDAPILRID